MMISRHRLTIVAVLAASVLALPANAQTSHSTRPDPGAHHGGLHGTKSMHPTPKRQHMMEQVQRAQSARHRGDGQSSETDRLNSQSLQRVQQGEGVAPAGPGTMGAIPGGASGAPAR